LAQNGAGKEFKGFGKRTKAQSDGEVRGKGEKQERQQPAYENHRVKSRPKRAVLHSPKHWETVNGKGKWTPNPKDYPDIVA